MKEGCAQVRSRFAAHHNPVLRWLGDWLTWLEERIERWGQAWQRRDGAPALIPGSTVPAVDELREQLAAAQREAQSWQQEATTWQQLAVVADAEQQALRAQVDELKQRIQVLRHELDLKALQSHASANTRPRHPRVFLLGGNGQRQQTVDALRSRYGIEFDFLPSEREKGHSRDAMQSIRSRTARADAVIIVTDYIGHDKQNVAIEVCRQHGISFRQVKTLSSSTVEAALRDLLPARCADFAAPTNGRR